MMIEKFEKLEFLDNNSPSTFPDGLDVEIFNFSLLSKAKKKVRDKFDLEHVTTFMKKLKLIKEIIVKKLINLNLDLQLMN